MNRRLPGTAPDLVMAQGALIWLLPMALRRIGRWVILGSRLLALLRALPDPFPPLLGEAPQRAKAAPLQA